jgi:hypothetical protein
MNIDPIMASYYRSGLIWMGRGQGKHLVRQWPNFFWELGFKWLESYFSLRMCMLFKWMEKIYDNLDFEYA